VVAFLGSSAQSCEVTASKLRELFGFDGHGYCDYERMLDAERIDALSVCTPDALHGQHALKALERGIHVLCEKPLVWLEGASHREILALAERVVAAAEPRSLVLGVNTQYVAALPFYYDLFHRHRGGIVRARTFYCATTSVLRRPGETPIGIWRDLAPHPISLLLAALPEGTLDEASVNCTIGQTGSVAEFGWTTHRGPCRCKLVVGKVSADEVERSFGINDFVVHYTGRNGPDGVFRTYLRGAWEEEEHEYPDLMRLSVEAFVGAVRGRGRVIADGRAAVRNLELQLRLLELAAA
jgi:predicted dehydrogenase